MWPFKNILSRTDLLNKVVYLNNNLQWPRQLLTKPPPKSQRIRKLWEEFDIQEHSWVYHQVLPSPHHDDTTTERMEDSTLFRVSERGVRPLRLTETLETR